MTRPVCDSSRTPRMEVQRSAASSQRIWRSYWPTLQQRFMANGSFVASYTALFLMGGRGHLGVPQVVLEVAPLLE
jgi:hypothetical protein